MAKLFLSYSRKDETRARRFSEWLEREGHDVWRDEEDIGGGASFSSEIEKALKDCDAVLVLWSGQSVQSAWVRDEAAYGRDAGKLIPFSLDGADPPLGFRQFQAIALSRWKGLREPPDVDRIRSAIARVANLPPPQPRAAARRLPEFGFQKPLVAGGAIAALVAAAVGLFLWQPWGSARNIVIAVVPSAQSSDRAMAADYANFAAADMASFLPRRFDRATVIAPADAGSAKSAYRMEIALNPHGAAADASITLTDTDGQSALWSRSWSVPDASAGELKAQVSEAASKAALCLTDARGGSRRLSQPTLGLYLQGCTDLGKTRLSNAEFVGLFEKITKLQPDFAPGWAYLALSRAWIAESLQASSPARHDAAVRSAREAIAVARKLNPNSSMTYDAEYHLIDVDPFKGLEVLEQGAKLDPTDGRIQMHLSEAYQSVGRMADAVEAAENGTELEPGTPYTRSQYILALIFSGQFSKAKADLASARAKWPDDTAIDLADFTLQYRYGDPHAALQLLPRVADNDAGMASLRKVIAARIDPEPAKIDEAIAALEQDSRKPEDRNVLLNAFGNFGRVDQAYQLLEDPSFQPFLDRSSLFRPDFAAVRADPRFMRVAARVGLVHYWRESGNWPDFCTSEKLKYDCKTEAAKYG